MSLATEILDAIPDRATRAAVGRVLARYKGQNVYVPDLEKRSEEKATALRCIEAGLQTPEIISILIERFDTSESTARRILQKTQESRWEDMVKFRINNWE